MSVSVCVCALHVCACNVCVCVCNVYVCCACIHVQTTCTVCVYSHISLCVCMSLLFIVSLSSNCVMVTFMYMFVCMWS